MVKGSDDILFADARERLDIIAGALRSNQLGSVAYVLTGGSKWPNGRTHKKVHEVELAIDLVLPTDARVSLSWGMKGTVEGLAVAVDSQSGQRLYDDVTRVDVGNLSEWQPFIGKRLAISGIATHIPDGTNRATVWSLRLTAESSSFVIALGEWTGTRPEYLPDSLVAIFDEAVARAFVIPDNPVSAWGIDWPEHA